MMNRRQHLASGWFALLAWIVLTAMPGASRAQILADDAAGYPLRSLIVPVSLTAGRTYSFSTQEHMTVLPGSGIPDSVLAIGAYGALGTLAGADGCFTSSGFRWDPSCFDFTPTTSGYYVLYLRAWRTETPGKTSLWMRDVTGNGAWTSISNIMTFGGAVGTTNAGTSRLFLHTQHRPGVNTYHTIWSTMPNEWQIVSRTSATGRVGTTAMIDVPNAWNANLGGSRRHIAGSPFASGVGGVRLLQNTWFQPGADVDGDGLGAPLEAALHTCDSVTSPNPSTGFTCASLEGCTDPASTLCKSSLRDTDHDGLRDDVEVWGYDDPLLEIARWGAEPARMDVFIELDTYDQIPSTTATCDGFESLASIDLIGGPGPAPAPFFDRLEQVYSSGPTHLNPNGSSGIRLHFDLGVNNPDPTDDHWGNWGGGNTCLPMACDYKEAYNNDADCPTNTMTTSRRWVFAHGVDGLTGTGQEAWGLAFGANQLSHFAHEVGHLGHLHHPGPEGSAADHGRGEFANYRPNYPSRMNYLYQDFGNTNGSNQAAWEAVSFSRGDWLGGLSTLDAPEVCPFPGQDLSLLLSVGELASYDSTAGCWNVDWNRDTSYSGSSYMKQFATRSFVSRWSRLDPVRERYAAWSMALAGDALLVAGTRKVSQEEVMLRADTNADCPEYPLDVRGSGTAEDPEYFTGGSYPGCIRPGLPLAVGHLRAIAVGIAGARVPSAGGGLEEGALMVRNDYGYLRWERLRVAATTIGFYEASVTIESSGTVAGAANVNEGFREPAVARIPATDETLLVFPNSSGRLYQATLAPGGTSFSALSQARSGGVQITSSTAVSLVARDGKVWMADTNATGNIRIYERTGSGVWTVRATLGETTRLRPSIAIADDVEVPTSRRMYVYYSRNTAGATEQTAFVRSGLNNFASYGGVQFVLGGQLAGGAPTALWDGDFGAARVGRAGLRLLRITHATVPTTGVGCTVPGDCAWAGPGATCDAVLERCRIDSEHVGTMELAPFAQGPAPGVYTDYDDWRGLRWGYCESRKAASVDAPDFVDQYVPTSYRSQDCGTIPVYPEPIEGGMAVVGPAPENDRTLYPWLYETGEVVCEQP